MVSRSLMWEPAQWARAEGVSVCRLPPASPTPHPSSSPPCLPPLAALAPGPMSEAHFTLAAGRAGCGRPILQQMVFILFLAPNVQDE